MGIAQSGSACLTCGRSRHVDGGSGRLTSALLVSGRRGPFPSYRLNGVYVLACGQGIHDGHSFVADTVALPTAYGGGARPNDIVVRRFLRVDRPEVSFLLSYGDDSLDWRCELAGKELARSEKPRNTGHLPIFECHVCSEKGGTEVDEDIVVVSFPAPAPASLESPTAGADAVRWSCWKANNMWERRSIFELPAPTPLCTASHLDPKITRNDHVIPVLKYCVWGEPGAADPLVDLLQGGAGNCGIIAAIDALSYRDPVGRLGNNLQEGSTDSGSLSGAVAEHRLDAHVKLFDPCSGVVQEWSIGDGSVADGLLCTSRRISAAEFDVARGTAVPRYARTLSSRAWALLLEMALADIAGGYNALVECEPGMAWLALLGHGVAITRYGANGRGNEMIWRRCIPDVVRKPNKAGPNEWPSRRTRASAWIQAKGWSFTGEELTSAELEGYLEVSVLRGSALCVYPATNLRADKGAGEPCVCLDVCFSELPPFSNHLDDVPTVDLAVAQETPRVGVPGGVSVATGKAQTEINRFAVGHCYSVRAIARVGTANELWVRIRDPRRIRLFWAKWSSIVGAADADFYVYSCEMSVSQKPVENIETAVSSAKPH
eukprot:TRINITY_DN68309_c0_g1_i1.p1 TRINITY_DN68309_c0_g1~~TRINITY_DN68309_c0_g1_i1.p1  ORF type:complete len:603 (+),score=84.86 TRINITY_DN68309_c0_g1_i1:35-1843(+)